MRLLVGVEGKELPDGRTIEPGALFVTDEVVSVTWGPGVARVIGHASDLQRDENLLSMEVKFTEEAKAFETMKPDDFLAACFCSPVESSPLDVNRIVSGQVRNVAVAFKNQGIPLP